MNKDYGELLDPFNGIEDLKNKLIRTCAEPNKTFDDDPLRMMRAIRFASQLNFDIEESTFKSICDNAQRIEIISQERITDELNKIILSDKPSYGFKLGSLVLRAGVRYAKVLTPGSDVKEAFVVEPETLNWMDGLIAVGIDL